MPYWTPVAATPLLIPAIADRRRLATALVVLLFGTGLVAGSGQVLVQPLTIGAIAMFAALALLLPGPRRATHIAATVATGVALGAAGGAHALTVLASPPHDFPRPRDMFATQVLHLPGSATIQLIVLAVARVCVAVAPRLGMTLALLTPPVLVCAVTLIGNDFLFAGDDRFDKLRTLALITAVDLILTLVSTTRAAHRTAT